MAETVQEALRERLEDDRPGVKYGDRVWSWREHLAEASAEAARTHRVARPGPAGHVGTLLGNTPAMLRAMAGAALGGYVICGINTTRRGAALAADVRRADCQVLLTDAEHLPLLDGLDLTGVRVIEVDSDDRHGMYWSGDLAYRDADGWIYLAGRTSDWMRVDGENLAAAPIERILERLDVLSRVAVYAVPDEHVGDQVMAAIMLRDGAELTPGRIGEFLAAQPDLSPKAWPRYVRIAPDLPATATNKVVKRVLIAQGATPGEGTLWERETGGTAYAVTATMSA